MIYVHIPFCRSFCTYCDFYSEIASDCGGTFGKFAKALVREIEARSDEITEQTKTLYIGGGTPSVLPLSVFRELTDALKRVGHGGPFDEFTVEVNPDDIIRHGPSYVEGLLDLGVNRISMGVQSFDDSILRWMNRRHDSAAAVKAYAILEDAGVENISIDLIFGLPQMSDKGWKDTLSKALEISSMGRLPQHISSYQLSVESGSALAGMVERGSWQEASDELCERQYMMLCETLSSAGYGHYEISNFALPGYEAKHNGAYWRHVPYAGFGPGAHSLIIPFPYLNSQIPQTPEEAASGSMIRRWNDADLKRYMEDPLSVQGSECLTSEQKIMEKIMLGLRTSEGLPEQFMRHHCDPAALETALCKGNLVLLDTGFIRIPEERFFVSDNIISSVI